MRQPVAAEETATEPEPEGAFVGSCPAMGEVYKAIGRVADQDVPVLITGESGTGKELVARAIYQHGPRAKAPFLALNCAAIPEQPAGERAVRPREGRLHRRRPRRIGKFEQCHGGTIFLDEIGDMPLSLQAKILRLLQEQAFERVGGNETIRTDVRLIAATHRDLKAWSAEGQIPAGPVLPAGRLHHPLAAAARARRRPAAAGAALRAPLQPGAGPRSAQVAPEALERLRAIRGRATSASCRASSKQALLQASGTVLLPAFLPESLARVWRTRRAAADREEPGWRHSSSANGSSSEVRDLYADTHRQVDRRLLPRVLEYTGGNLQQAALLLGIARQTLRLKLRDLGLSIMRTLEAEDEDAA